MAAQAPGPGELSEEQLRVAYEQEIKRVRVEHVLLENVVTLINLGMRRTGLMPGTEDERDPAQVQLAIDSVTALMPQLERVAPEQLQAIRDAVAQLQLAFVQAQGGATTPAATEQQPADPTGPAQRSGRLWVPGQ
ncbi:hypothetical protein [Conexibacter sp. S30A1]|jgi:hypothetical protein|uniref:hypothetical protein n=1 Tax=Conexibacter sp. S30A1 TaxID=2937800 RepID=UPI00201039BC|nr:hypothetical protein [Conexibacter sp. S30A1]